MVGLVSIQTKFFKLRVLGPEVKKIPCGTPYKFNLLKSPKISTLWESFHHFLLKYQNSMKPTTLERGHIRMP
jgi:hypothetical protein